MATRIRSLADFMTYWSRLLQALDANQPILPDLTQLREHLQAIVDEVTTVMASQDAHRAGLQTETQRLNVLMVRGRDVSAQLRAAIVSHLGPRDPKLAEFRMRFLGKPRAVRKDEPDTQEAAQ